MIKIISRKEGRTKGIGKLVMKHILRWKKIMNMTESKRKNIENRAGDKIMMNTDQYMK